MLNWISPRLRITLGLASIAVSALLFASMLGIIPDHERDAMKARGNLCETLAVAGCQLIANGDADQLETLIGFVVERNDDVISARVRSVNGDSLAVVGPHEWVDQEGESLSNDSQVNVPLRTTRGPWGSFEVKFRPLSKGGWFGWLSNSRYRLYVFAGSSLAVAFFFYLSRILRQLDPSRAVPPHVRAALDTIADGLLLLDANERIAFANKAFADKMGVEAEKLQGEYAAKLPWSPECLKQVVAFPWADGIADEDREGVLLKLKAKDRPERVLQTNASVVQQDGKYYGALVSLDDVTVLEKTKVELEKSKLAADDANRAKSDFLARMSHEIRTPMTAILGFADVLRRGYETDADERQEYLETIHSSGAHLLELINDILDLSKVESGKMELDEMSYPPASIINEVTSILGVRAREKGIDLSYSFDTEIPETITTDAVRLRQALTNLVGNAIKFTEVGEVHVGVSLDRAGTEPMLLIDVTDTGIGIAQDKLDKVFQPFAQADTSITRKFGGTGLGLAISRKLARALGGDLTVQSEVGKGSIFSCRIAAGSLDGVTLIAPERVELSSAKKQAVLNSLDGGRFLMADDGESNRRLVTIVLKRLGATVEAVENGLLAVEAAETGEYDAILMDMQMPVMDGVTATQTLRKKGCTLPIIALTADAVGDAQAKCLAAGCSHYLSKPIEMEALSALLAEIIGSEKSAEPAKLDANETKAAPAAPALPPKVAEVSRQAVSGESKAPLAAATAERVAAEAAIDRPAVDAAEERLAVERAVAAKAVEKAAAEMLRAEKMAAESAAAEMMRTEAVAAEVAAAKKMVAAEADSRRTEEAGAGPDIIPDLPMDDADFRSIAEDFLLRLDEQFVHMETAIHKEDYTELYGLAHWLKGAGGTVGLPAFTAPSLRLEEAAEHELFDDVQDCLRELRGIKARVKIPTLVQNNASE